MFIECFDAIKIPIHRAARIEPDKNGDCRVIDIDGQVYQAWLYSVERALEPERPPMMASPPGYFVIKFFDNAGTADAGHYKSAVIGWITPQYSGGTPMPVCVDQYHGEDGDYAILAPDGSVILPGDRTFASQADWLAYETQRREAVIEREAEQKAKREPESVACPETFSPPITAFKETKKVPSLTRERARAALIKVAKKFDQDTAMKILKDVGGAPSLSKTKAENLEAVIAAGKQKVQS